MAKQNEGCSINSHRAIPLGVGFGLRGGLICSRGVILVGSGVKSPDSLNTGSEPSMSTMTPLSAPSGSPMRFESKSKIESMSRSCQANNRKGEGGAREDEREGIIIGSCRREETDAI